LDTNELTGTATARTTTPAKADQPRMLDETISSDCLDSRRRLTCTERRKQQQSRRDCRIYSTLQRLYCRDYKGTMSNVGTISSSGISPVGVAYKGKSSSAHISKSPSDLPAMRLTILPESALLFFSAASSFFSALPSFLAAFAASSFSASTPEASFLRSALS